VRLLTPRGALGPLGHPEYGSRLVELIGRRNDETARNLARLYTLQAVREEPRVAELLELAVETTPDRPDSIRIDFAVRPVGDDEPLALGLEVAL
jgi:phage baseplate assembly protein W